MSKRRATLDIWIVWFFALINVDKNCPFSTEIPNVGGLLLMNTDQNMDAMTLKLESPVPLVF